jgi:hypothetical protein
MIDIKSGDVAFIQTSQEPVFVLNIGPGTSLQQYPQLTGTVATVRRPSEGEQGIRHSIEYFAIEELESLASRQVRQIKEMEEMQNAFEKRSGKSTKPAGDIPLPN